MDNLLRNIRAPLSPTAFRLPLSPFQKIMSCHQSLLPSFWLASLALLFLQHTASTAHLTFLCYDYIGDLRGLLASTSSILTPGSTFVLANLIVLLIFVMSTSARPCNSPGICAPDNLAASGGAARRSQRADAIIPAECYDNGVVKGSLNFSDCIQLEILREEPLASGNGRTLGADIHTSISAEPLQEECLLAVRPGNHDNGVGKENFHVINCMQTRDLREETLLVQKRGANGASKKKKPVRASRAGGKASQAELGDNGSVIKGDGHVNRCMRPRNVGAEPLLKKGGADKSESGRGPATAKYMVRSKSDQEIARLRSDGYPEASSSPISPDLQADNHPNHDIDHCAENPKGLASTARAGKMRRVRTVEHGLSSMLITDHHQHHHHNRHHHHHRHADHHAHKLSTRRVPMENLSNDELNQRFTDFINRRFAEMKREALVPLEE